MNISSFLGLVISGALLFLAGCASTESSRLASDVSNAALPVQMHAAFDADTLPRELLEELEALSPATPCQEIDALLIFASAACDEGQFSAADSLLRLANEQTSEPCRNGEGVMEDPAGFHERLSEIYTEKMPHEYLDCIPDNLSAMAFRRQLSLSLDSLYRGADSALQIDLNCSEAAPYTIPMPSNERVHKAVVIRAKKSRGYYSRVLSRANYYLPYMRQVFADSGLPSDLAFLPVIESGFNPLAYSHAHASGIWQFIPSTGRIYKLRQDFWIDERRDIIRSTRAAASYLKKLYRDFGDWHLSLAAYNCGEGCVGRAIKKAEAHDFWSLKLPRETMNYVPHYLASLMITKNPRCFGIDPGETSIFDLDTVFVSECLDLNKAANALGIDFDSLKTINPHLLRWCTPPDMQNVIVYLPKGKADDFRVWSGSLSDEDKISWYRYKIKSGDNLGAIAAKFKLSVPAIKSVNKLTSSRIIAGKHLFIPIPVSKKAEEPASGIARGDQAPPKPSASPKKGTRLTYKVKPGDTISELADLFGVSPRDICQWNNLSSPRALKAGSLLVLYTNKAKSAVAPAHADAKTSGAPQKVLVEKGDNLYSIARRLGCTVDDMAHWNDKNVDNPLIYAGETLLYYKDKIAQPAQANLEKDNAADKTKARERKCSDCVLYKIAPGDNASALSRMFGVSIDTLLACNGLSRNSVLKAGDLIRIPPGDKPFAQSQRSEKAKVVFYQVRKGDNLWRIANLFGVPVDHLYRTNGLHKNSVLIPGDTLRVVVMEEL